jgi:hypothetical protein
VVTFLVATSMATLSSIGDVSHMGIVSSLGQTVSGWRDLNSRPLDPQIGGLVFSRSAERATYGLGRRRRAARDPVLNSWGPTWA